MAAGLGFKDFTTGEVLTAADVDGYLMQGVWVFASAAARTSAVASPQEGNMSFLKDTNSLEYYSGAAWVAVAGGSTGPTFTGCSLYKSANQSINNGTWTTVTWDSELFDTDGYHDNSTNSDRITIPAGKAGKYRVSANFAINNSGSNNVQSYFGLNASQLVYIGPVGGNSSSIFAATAQQYVNLSVGDYLTFAVIQSSGSAQNFRGGTGESYFNIEYLGA
jgi:hypothetical protein